MILVREMLARREKNKEKITKRRENKGIILENKVAMRLFKRRIIIEKVGNKKREAVEANCPSPQGRE